ncbi:MAG: hypothetical protein N2249_00075, partial [Melioribacter sp.]|nr:hypothetical protein [Melioribacter sp.]
MKTLISSILLTAFVVLFLITNTTAQSNDIKIGKIFAKEEANQLFGKPVISIPVSKALIKAALAKADKYVLFTLKGKLPLILNSRRTSLLDENYTLEGGEKAFVFSKEVVEEFLNSTKEQIIYFEIRGVNSSERNPT